LCLALLAWYFVTFVDSVGFLFCGLFSQHLWGFSEWYFASLDSVLFMSSSLLVLGKLVVILEHYIAPNN
jgi:hypothetical protein